MADFKNTQKATETVYQMMMKFVDKNYDFILFVGK